MQFDTIKRSIKRCANEVAAQQEGQRVLKEAAATALFCTQGLRLQDTCNTKSALKVFNLSSNLRPQAFNLNALSPAEIDVRRHARHMVSRLADAPSDNRRMRLTGFFLGSLSCGDQRLIRKGDDASLNTVLTTRQDQDNQLLLNAFLGYLQGWLWAKGFYSLEVLHRMNAPEGSAAAA